MSAMEKMPTERWARLMAVSMANNLEESWISEHPTQMFQYFPTIVELARIARGIETLNYFKSNTGTAN